MKFAKIAAIGATSATLSKFNRNAGRKYLVSRLGAIPGLPRKASQLLGTKLGIEQGCSKLEPMPLELVRELIDQNAPGLSQELSEIDSKPQVASLGQVHRGKLRSGQEVAIKVQFPGVEEEVTDQLDILLAAFKKVGPAKFFELDLESYRSSLRAHFARETDYRLEAQSQQIFERRWQNTFLVVPKVFQEYSGKRILVQSFEASETLDEVARLEEHIRTDCSMIFASMLLTSIFGTRLVHCDLHLKNFGFRTESKKLVLYDFGSTLDVDLKHAQYLMELVKLAGEGDKGSRPSPFDYFVSLGFDGKKLGHISREVFELNRFIFAPFRSNDWRADTWRLNENLDDILGGNKWWFRTAGPPWFLIFMRAVQGWRFATERLKSPLPLRSLFDMVCRNYPELHSNLVVPDFKSIYGGVSGATKNSGKALRVLVKEGTNEVVSLTMPVRAVDDLENLVPSQTRDRIHESGHDLLKIKEEVRRSGYRSQTLFDTQAGLRNYRVWIE